jgi:hypothetical protein
MDSVIVGIIVGSIVGSFSGVLGAVLGPIVTSWLRGREHRQEREREIHRELREMIEERLGESGTELAFAVGIAAYMHGGMTPADAYTRALNRHLEKSNSATPRHRWEPYRVTDERLRGLVEQFIDTVSDLHDHHATVRTVPRDQWWAEVLESEPTLRDMQRQVRLRLDELRW